MTKTPQLLTIQAQVQSFHEIGFQASFKTTMGGKGYTPVVFLRKGDKTYRFCDPDWEVVIGQLSTLYRKVNITHKEK